MSLWFFYNSLNADLSRVKNTEFPNESTEHVLIYELLKSAISPKKSP
jgi:hypothetical protein